MEGPRSLGQRTQEGRKQRLPQMWRSRKMLLVNSNLEVRSSDTEQMTDREGKVRSADLWEDKGTKGRVEDRQVRLTHFKTKVTLLRSP